MKNKIYSFIIKLFYDFIACLIIGLIVNVLLLSFFILYIKLFK